MLTRPIGWIFGALLGLVVAAPSAASDCQDFCNKQHARCTDFYCNPIRTGCAGGCSLWFTNYPNMCSRTCGNEPLDACRRAVMEKAGKCWEGCWRRRGQDLEQYGQCMTPCSKTAEAELERCRQGGGPFSGGTVGGPGSGGTLSGVPPPVAVPPVGPPPMAPPRGATTRCCGDGNCPTVIEQVRAGRPYHLVFDLSYAKFDDSRYSGDDNDPLGTIKGGQSYRCQYLSGDFTCSGFHQGSNRMASATYRNADPCELQVSLWGRVFTLCGDKILDARYGIVGHVLAE